MAMTSRFPGEPISTAWMNLLTDREREMRDRVRVWCDTEVAPAAVSPGRINRLCGMLRFRR